MEHAKNLSLFIAIVSKRGLRFFPSKMEMNFVYILQYCTFIVVLIILSMMQHYELKIDNRIDR